MKLYNSLGREFQEFKPIKPGFVSIYSCGPTVYERAHIGNLASFIYADTLRRVLSASGYDVKHVMNITDVDDKTIATAKERYPDLEPNDALRKLTSELESQFMDDLKAVGVDVDAIQFVKATENIESMQGLIKELLEAGVAYAADDGIYFSIEKYRQAGKNYGQLTNVTADDTSHARINNDEYDKDNAHDFALWKKQKDGEPAWDFEVSGKNIKGRPGWHIECSAMSTKFLGQPFDIHTGGVDLKFPHHENEIAQSTAADGEVLANFFFHNEHMLVDGKKMSKSLHNFYTLEDIQKKGFNLLAFRLLVLQSHYRSQSNFSWEGLGAAQNRLKKVYAWADLVHQTNRVNKFMDASGQNTEALEDDLRTGDLLVLIELNMDIAPKPNLLEKLDQLLGLNLSNRPDASEQQKKLISERETARKNDDWQSADEFRGQLEKQGIGINDTDRGPVWYRS